MAGNVHLNLHLERSSNKLSLQCQSDETATELLTSEYAYNYDNIKTNNILKFPFICFLRLIVFRDIFCFINQEYLLNWMTLQINPD